MKLKGINEVRGVKNFLQQYIDDPVEMFVFARNFKQKHSGIGSHGGWNPVAKYCQNNWSAFVKHTKYVMFDDRKSKRQERDLTVS